MASLSDGQLGNKPFVAQWLIWTAILATLGGVLGVEHWRNHQAIEQRERTHLLTQVRVANQLMTKQIRSADAALRTLLENLDRWRGPDGQFLPFAHDHLKRVEKMMPGVRTFAVLDADGRCLLSNRKELLGGDFSARTYFKSTASDFASGRLQVAPPYETVLKVWAITISRPILGPQGEFAGAVIATLAPDYVTSILKSLSYADDMRVTLLHDSGQVYATTPADEAMLRRNFSQGDNFFSQHQASGLEYSSHWGEGLDGLQRMAMAQKVDLAEMDATHGFVAVTGRSLQAVFAPWWRETYLLVILWGATALLSAMALLRYQTATRRLLCKAEVAQRALEEMAYRDPLTGAENRRSFMAQLGNEWERVRRTTQPGALLMIDIDHFKQINDAHGHDAGDRVLVELVELLKKGLRSIDTVGRLGGEEFVILLPETPLEVAKDVAERLRSRVETSPVSMDTGTVSFTISVGVSAIEAHSPNVQEALRQADAAMYQAKQSGRNRVCGAG